MGFLVSPGVEVKEIDLTNVIPAVSTSIGGFVGEFRWGPVGEAITVSSEKELASNFGAPDADNAESFLTAASFLKYGNTLKVSRAIASTATNATVNVKDSVTDSQTVPLVKNYSNFKELTGLNTGYIFLARYPGAIANGVTIYYAAAGGTINTAVGSAFTNPVTGISTWSAAGLANNAGGLKDEIHVAIVDTQGNFSGTKGTILEKWEGLSLFTDAKNENGSSNYYVDVISANSSYIYVTNAALVPALVGKSITRSAAYAAQATWNTGLTTGISSDDVLGASDSQVVLFGTKDDGTDGEPSAGEYSTAAEVFADAELIDVNLLFTSLSGDTVNAIENKLIEIAIARKDCVAFISAPLSVSTSTSDSARKAKVIAKFSSATSTSYAVFDSTPLYVYNKYSDQYIYIPASGHMAGLCANTDNVAEPWFSPAGYNRGNLLGVTKLAFNPKQADRDELYKARINPIVSFPGQGILLFGDKTAQSKPSAFDRINVRRLFITLEKAVATAAKYQLFELNDEFTRAMFRNMVEPFLREVKGRRGVTDFLVICDETNNTGEVIDTNRFVADIYIKPARSINFITLNFIATRTGVQFSEIVGQ
jgi:phage tail sheath protein FI